MFREAAAKEVIDRSRSVAEVRFRTGAPASSAVRDRIASNRLIGTVIAALPWSIAVVTQLFD